MIEILKCVHFYITGPPPPVDPQNPVYPPGYNPACPSAPGPGMFPQSGQHPPMGPSAPPGTVPYGAPGPQAYPMAPGGYPGVPPGSVYPGPYPHSPKGGHHKGHNIGPHHGGVNPMAAGMGMGMGGHKSHKKMKKMKKKKGHKEHKHGHHKHGKVRCVLNKNLF